jgi:Cu+-exporting ATPase
LLGAGRPEFERSSRSKLERRLSEAAPGGLGVQLDGLTVHDLHPPQDVVAAYHSVADAIQKRDKTVNEAKAEGSRIVSRAEEDSFRIIRSAEADAIKKVSEATAARDVILTWQAARTTLTQAEESAVGTDHAKREQLLATKRYLTEFRLSLDAIVAVLKTRDKILIDADKLPGARKLYLLDPDLMPKTPVPMAFPRGGPIDQRDPP